MGRAGSKPRTSTGAIHLWRGEETSTFCIDWQDSDATMRWLEMMSEEHPRGRILLWIDGATDHTSEEVEEWLEEHQRIHLIHFPAYTPEENPKEATWEVMKEEWRIITGRSRWQSCGKRSMITIRERSRTRSTFWLSSGMAGAMEGSMRY
jgi:transposase